MQYNPKFSNSSKKRIFKNKNESRRFPNLTIASSCEASTLRLHKVKQKLLFVHSQPHVEVLQDSGEESRCRVEIVGHVLRTLVALWIEVQADLKGVVLKGVLLKFIESKMNFLGAVQTGNFS